jgi:hypothetical protein
VNAVGTAGAGAHAPAPARGGRFDVRDVVEGVVIVAAAVVAWIAASALPAAPVEGELASGRWPQALAVAGSAGSGVDRRGAARARQAR